MRLGLIPQDGSHAMARSDEAEWWFNAVYSAVQEVLQPLLATKLSC